MNNDEIKTQKEAEEKLAIEVAISRKKRRESPPDNIEKDGDDIWLLDDNKRIKKICGHPLKARQVGSGKFCRYSAGRGTNHKGIGYCYLHSFKVSELNPKNSIVESFLVMKSGLGAKLKDKLIKLDINENMISSVDTEIIMLYGFVYQHLEDEIADPVVAGNAVQDLLKQIALTKKIKWEMEAKNLFTKEEVFKIMKMLMQTAKSILDVNDYMKLASNYQAVVGNKILIGEVEVVENGD